MRRIFLFQMIACGIAFVSSGNLVFALNPPEGPADTDAIQGEWHLLDPAADEVNVPQHRMDLRFKKSSGELKGAILSRRDGSEIPLASSEFDGSTLRFTMAAPKGKTQSEMPIMVMTWTGVKFEGYWKNGAGETMGPKLKLVRATK
jgi:hypothetical protein